MVVEIAVGYLGSFLLRRANGLLERAGVDIEETIDGKLGELYEWVKGKIFGKPAGEVSLEMLEEKPDGEKQRKAVTDLLADAVAGDDAANAELTALIADLDRLRGPITIEGLATAKTMKGSAQLTGLEVGGGLEAGEHARGEVHVGEMTENTKAVGTRYTKGRS